MKNIISSALICGFTLLVCNCSQAANRIKVEVLRGSETVALVNLPDGQIKAAAKNFKYDDKSGFWTLNDGCAITIIQDEKHSLRFEGDTAKITADEIEWQIYSNSPIDYPNIPLIDLSKALGQDPKSNLFRVKWFYSMGSYTSNGTALYDRRSQTIKEYVSEGDWEHYGRDSRLFKGVTDDMINKMSQEIGMKGSGPFSFGLVTQFGATRKDSK